MELSKSALKKLEKQKEKDLKKQQIADRLVRWSYKAAEKAARENAPDYSEGRYGHLKMNQSSVAASSNRILISDIGSAHIDQTVNLRARIQVSRPTGFSY